MNKNHLEAPIEINLDLAWNSDDKYIREQAHHLAENYALQYKKLTGHYFVRECKK